MTLRQIAEAAGMKETTIKRLFVGINEIEKDEELKAVISCAGATISEVIDTKGIKDQSLRIKLLEQRGKKEISRADFRKEIKKCEQNQSPAEVIPRKGIVMLEVFPDSWQIRLSFYAKPLFDEECADLRAYLERKGYDTQR
jgi:hypothetical protein